MISPAASVVVKGNGLVFVVVGRAEVVGGGTGRVVQPQILLIDVKKGVVVVKDPDEH